MINTARDLFYSLFEDAIDCVTIPKYSEYCNMSSAYAQRVIIRLLEPNVLYKIKNTLLIRIKDRLISIYLPKQSETAVRVELPYSPKWLFNGNVKGSQLRWIECHHFLYWVIRYLTK